MTAREANQSMQDEINDLRARLDDATDQWIAQVEQQRTRAERAEANYQFMVDRACNEKLDGYRELGAESLANLERAERAEADAVRLRAVLRRAGQRLKASLSEGDLLQEQLAAVGDLHAEECVRRREAEHRAERAEVRGVDLVMRCPGCDFNGPRIVAGRIEWYAVCPRCKHNSHGATPLAALLAWHGVARPLATSEDDPMAMPHTDPVGCPTWHDWCHCTVDALEYAHKELDQWVVRRESAERAEAAGKRLTDERDYHKAEHQKHEAEVKRLGEGIAKLIAEVDGCRLVGDRWLSQRLAALLEPKP